jgi:threonine synthase
LAKALSTPPFGVESFLEDLEGSESGRRYSANELATVDPDDGRPLLARYNLSNRRTLSAAALASRPGGLWRWRELLPVRSPERIVYLGEGDTPLLRSPRLGSFLGARNLRLKCEGLNPTGSFKARGMAVAVSRAVELGARSFVAPSAGNAGGALAAYGAAVGAPVTILMPVDAPRANQAEVQMCGARLVLVDGLIDDCGRLAAQIASETGAFNVSTLKEPYRVEGKKTMGLELAWADGWKLPDVVVYPTGGGTGLIGMWKAFDELERLGFIGEQRPRMVAVQASGCAPIVAAFIAGADCAAACTNASTRAAGIRVPGTIGDKLILKILRSSGGTAMAIDESTIDSVQRAAGERGSGYVSPETAAALSAVPEMIARGIASRDDDIVVFDTGCGTKYPAPEGLLKPDIVDPDQTDIEQLLAAARLPLYAPSGNGSGQPGA